MKPWIIQLQTTAECKAELKDIIRIFEGHGIAMEHARYLIECDAELRDRAIHLGATPTELNALCQPRTRYEP